MRRTGTPLPTDHLQRLRRVLDARGERFLAEAAGLNRATLGRALAGLPVLPGTHALIREGLARAEKEVG